MSFLDIDKNGRFIIKRKNHGNSWNSIYIDMDYLDKVSDEIREEFRQKLNNPNFRPSDVTIDIDAYYIIGTYLG